MRNYQTVPLSSTPCQVKTHSRQTSVPHMGIRHGEHHSDTKLALEIMFMWINAFPCTDKKSE